MRAYRDDCRSMLALPLLLLIRTARPVASKPGAGSGPELVHEA